MKFREPKLSNLDNGSAIFEMHIRPEFMLVTKGNADRLEMPHEHYLSELFKWALDEDAKENPQSPDPGNLELFPDPEL